MIPCLGARRFSAIPSALVTQSVWELSIDQSTIILENASMTRNSRSCALWSGAR